MVLKFVYINGINNETSFCSSLPKWIRMKLYEGDVVFNHVLLFKRKKSYTYIILFLYSLNHLYICTLL